MRLTLVFIALLLCASYSSAQACNTRSAGVINACSCSASDIQTSLNAITTDNDTVNIPAGTCTFTGTTTNVLYTQTVSFTLAGAGALSACAFGVTNCTGTGSDQTVILDGDTHNGAGPSLIQIVTLAGKSFTMSGIAVLPAPGQTTVAAGGLIAIAGNGTVLGSSQVRVHHNHFKSSNGTASVKFSDVFGVADHNFIETFGNSLVVFHGEWPSSSCPPLTCVGGHGSWNDFSYFGSSKFFFLEDNTASLLETVPEYINDCGNGGRIVIRHNTFMNNEAIQQHNGASGNEGCRAMEAYNNYALSNLPVKGPFIYGRSGTLLEYGNQISNYTSILGTYMDRSTSGQVDKQREVPNGFGMSGGLTNGATSSVTGTVTIAGGSGGGKSVAWNSGTQFTCANIPLNTVIIIIDGTKRQWAQISTCNSSTSLIIAQTETCVNAPCNFYIGSPWDGNTDLYGYPTLDQMGRGHSHDLITGAGFPGLVNHRTNTQFNPNQDSDPIYLFSGTEPAPGNTTYWSNGAIYGNTSKIVIENRDIYLKQPNPNEPSGTNCGVNPGPGTNCTVGVGQGLASQRPASCTPFVGYYETDTNILDECTSTNTWSTQNCSTGVDANGACQYTPYTYPHPLTGTTTATLSPSSNAFGNQTVGTVSGAASFTFSNTGSTVIAIVSIVINGANASQFGETDNCGSQVSTNSSCTINVTFQPTIESSVSATLTITDNATGSPHTASLTGTGVAPGTSIILRGNVVLNGNVVTQ